MKVVKWLCVCFFFNIIWLKERPLWIHLKKYPHLAVNCQMLHSTLFLWLTTFFKSLGTVILGLLPTNQVYISKTHFIIKNIFLFMDLSHAYLLLEVTCSKRLRLVQLREHEQMESQCWADDGRNLWQVKYSTQNQLHMHAYLPWLTQGSLSLPEITV